MSLSLNFDASINGIMRQNTTVFPILGVEPVKDGIKATRFSGQVYIGIGVAIGITSLVISTLPIVGPIVALAGLVGAVAAIILGRDAIIAANNFRKYEELDSIDSERSQGRLKDRSKAYEKLIGLNVDKQKQTLLEEATEGTLLAGYLARNYPTLLMSSENLF